MSDIIAKNYFIFKNNIYNYTHDFKSCKSKHFTSEAVSNEKTYHLGFHSR